MHAAAAPAVRAAVQDGSCEAKFMHDMLPKPTCPFCCSALQVHEVFEPNYGMFEYSEET